MMRRTLAYAARLLGAVGAGEQGQGLVEYALIIALVAILVIAAVLTLGNQLSGLFQHAADCLQHSGTC